MDEGTRTVEVVRGESVMTRSVTESLIGRITAKKGSEATRQTFRNEIRADADAFAGPSPSHVETVLAETAALALFALRTVERTYAVREDEGGMSFAQANYYLKKIEHAQRRLESSLRTLATVRRLAGSSIQLNVAQNQLVAGHVGKTA